MHFKYIIKIGSLLTASMLLSWISIVSDDESSCSDPELKSQLTQGDSLIAFAKTLEGLPYRPGGCSMDRGFDCSGLVKFTYDEFNINVGRSSRDQAQAGYAVASIDAKPGDIIVFARNLKGRIFHAGLVLSNSSDSLVMLHANKRNGVHITNITASSYWGPKVVDVRKVDRMKRP